MKNTLLLLTFTGCLLVSCSRNDEGGQFNLVQDKNRHERCEGSICSRYIAEVTVYLVDVDGKPVSIARRDINIYYTESKAPIAGFASDSESRASQVCIAQDMYIHHIAFKGISISVEINTDGHRPVTQTYTVNRDCCHVLNPEGQRLYLVLP